MGLLPRIPYKPQRFRGQVRLFVGVLCISNLTRMHADRIIESGGLHCARVESLSINITSLSSI